MKTPQHAESKTIITAGTAKNTDATIKQAQPETKTKPASDKKTESTNKALAAESKSTPPVSIETKAETPSIPTQTDQPEPIRIESAKNPTKADKAKVIYDEMIQVPENDRDAIAARIKKDLGVSKSAAQTYFYKFQRESGRAVEKQPTKADRAKPVYEQMMAEGKDRKQIIEAFINEVGLTKAGASTYYQNLKKRG